MDTLIRRLDKAVYCKLLLHLIGHSKNVWSFQIISFHVLSSINDRTEINTKKQANVCLLFGNSYNMCSAPVYKDQPQTPLLAFFSLTMSNWQVPPLLDISDQGD